VRVHLDRGIQAERQMEIALRAEMTHPHGCYQPSVMLKVKFGRRFPNWLGEMVRHFDLEEYDTSKYGAAIQAVGHARP
jgi:hypothetical protein